MSKPRYNWWPFVLNMIRDYPVRARDYKALHEQKITADITGMPRSGGASRTIEGVALRQLPKQQEQREYDAVHSAINHFRLLPDAKLRQDVVRLTFWKGYSIVGAADALHISDRTARRYRWQFAMLVGLKYGFLTQDEYAAEIKKDGSR